MFQTSRKFGGTYPLLFGFGFEQLGYGEKPVGLFHFGSGLKIKAVGLPPQPRNPTLNLPGAAFRATACGKPVALACPVGRVAVQPSYFTFFGLAVPGTGGKHAKVGMQERVFYALPIADRLLLFGRALPAKPFQVARDYFCRMLRRALVPRRGR